MTVETQDVNGQPVTQSGPYAGNGVTVSFDFDFPVEKAEAVRVLVSNAAGAETVLTLTTDYTVDLGGPAGGSITLTDAALAPTGSKLVIQYNGDFNQSAAISNQGNLNLSVLEAALDKTTMHLRQLKNETDRAVKVSAFIPLDAAAVEQLTEDIRNLGTIADDITTAADNIAAIVAAPGAATAAANSATAAAASKTAAANSATAAANSATAAADSATAAAASKTAAAASKTAAANSATAAANSATAAANSATAAADSATAAANSATEAADTLSGALTKTANLSDVSSVATARNNLDVAQKQTNTADVTAGRGMIVGAFGLGNTYSITPLSLDLNEVTRSGWYSADSSTANKPDNDSGNWIVLHFARTPGAAAQVAVSRDAANNGETWTRARDASTSWQPWVKSVNMEDIATQAQAEAGTNNDTVMTPLRTTNTIDARLASIEEAEAGVDTEKLMTPRRTAQYVTERLASQAQAEAGTNATKLMTPLLTAQAIAARAAEAQAERNFATRSAMLAAWSSLSTEQQNAISDGTVWSDGAVSYARKSGSTTIPDFPGWVPFGAINLDHFGVVKDGTVDNATAITAARAAAGAADTTITVPAGVYLSGGETYTVDSEAVFANRNFTTGFNLLKAARSAIRTLTVETANTSPLDPNKSRVGVSITAVGRGSNHVDGIRSNLINHSDDGQGNTAFYGHAVSDTAAKWSSALHGETRHAGGTSIAISSESTSFTTTGALYGLTLNNTSNTANTHPITGAASVAHPTATAIFVQGSGDVSPKGTWVRGIRFGVNSMRSGGVGILAEAPVGYHIKTETTAVASQADIFLGANSQNGVVLAGSYTGNAIRVNSGQAIAFNDTGTKQVLYDAGANELRLVSNSALRFAFNMSTVPALKIGSLQVLGKRKTGWSTPTGTATRATFDTSTVTVSELAERVNALIQDLFSHGLIGA